VPGRGQPLHADVIGLASGSGRGEPNCLLDRTKKPLP